MVPMMSEKPNTRSYYLDNGAGMCGTYEAPVVSGDIVFLREPWTRLKNPATGRDSDRVILAAEAGEAGALLYSSATKPEADSDYFTYAGDMSPEDHERMVAAINTDRPRRAEIAADPEKDVLIALIKEDDGLSYRP